uniref:DUF1016 N-terminal domain-containing protein n=1 Tax=Enterocloster clostridioformis TaxID=1531 RepID=UPI002F40CFEC
MILKKSSLNPHAGDDSKRSFYEKESINSGWSVRELKRQIDSSLYERLLLSTRKQAYAGERFGKSPCRTD